MDAYLDAYLIPSDSCSAQLASILDAARILTYDLVIYKKLEKTFIWTTSTARSDSLDLLLSRALIRYLY